MGAALLVAVVRSALSVAGANVVMLYKGPATTGGGLLLGCAAALARQHGLPSALLHGRRLGVLGLASLIFLVVLGWRGPGSADRVYFTWLMAVVDVASVLLVVSVVAVPRSLVARACSLGPLAWCGRISYSLYLVHPVVLVETVIHHNLLGPWRAIGASFLIAAALHRFVEQPLRRGNPFRLRRPRDAPAPAPA